MSTVQTNCKDCHVCTYARLIELFMKLTHGGQCKCPDKEDLQSALSGLAYTPLLSQEEFDDNNSVTEHIETQSDAGSDEGTITLPSSVVSSIHEAEPYMTEGLSSSEEQSTEEQSTEEQSTEEHTLDNEEHTTGQTANDYTSPSEANVFKPYSYNPFEGPEIVPSRNVGWSWNPDVSDYADKWFGPRDSDVESQGYSNQEQAEDNVKKALDPSFNWYIS